MLDRNGRGLHTIADVYGAIDIGLPEALRLQSLAWNAQANHNMFISRACRSSLKNNVMLLSVAAWPMCAGTFRAHRTVLGIESLTSSALGLQQKTGKTSAAKSIQKLLHHRDQEHDTPSTRSQSS